MRVNITLIYILLLLCGYGGYSQTITFNQPNPKIICTGDQVSITVSGDSAYAWTPSTGLSSISTNGINVIANPTSTTTYTVTGLKYGQKGTIVITVNPLPTVTVNPTPNQICRGQQASITATPAGAKNYLWSTGTSGISNSITVYPTVTSLYSVTLTDANGCKNSGTGSVVVNDNPGVTVTVTKSTILCNGESIEINGLGANTYVWSPGTGLNVTTGSLVTAKPSNTIIYSVTGTSNGCSASATITITVNQLPNVSYTSKSICIGETANLIASGASTYIWSPSTGLNTTTGANVNASPTATTMYYVLGTDGNGCKSKASGTVTVNGLPQIIVSGKNEICKGDANTLTASGGVGSTYKWSTGATGNSIAASPANPTNYFVTGTDSYGCKSTVSYTVKVNQLPTVTITSTPDPAVICNVTSITLNVLGNNIKNYKWSPANGLDKTSGSTVIASPNIQGTYTYSVSVTDLNGCINTATQKVIVGTIPDASIADFNFIAPDPPFTKCTQGGVIDGYNLVITNISNSSSTNTKYEINWGDGSPIESYNNITFGYYTTKSHNYISVGGYYLEITVTSNSVCKSSKIYNVFYGSSPTVGLNGPANTDKCRPFPFKFQISYKDQNNLENTAGTKYTVHVNDGAIDTVFYQPFKPLLPPGFYEHTFNKVSCNVTSQTQFGTEYNSYQVSIRASNNCGNKISEVVPIHISDKPNPDFKINRIDTIVCEKSQFIFTNNSTECDIYTNGTLNTNYKRNWIINASIPNGYTINSGLLGNPNATLQDPSTWGTDNLDITFNIPQTYLVELHVGNHCGDSVKTKKICVKPNPKANFIWNEPNLCSSRTVKFTNTSNTVNSCENASYKWNIGCGLNSNSCGNPECKTNITYTETQDATINFIKPGQYTIKLTAENGCPSTASNQTITIKSKPTGVIDARNQICQGDFISPTIQNVTDCYSNITSYKWSFQGGNPTSSTLRTPPNITYTKSDNYIISVTLTNACGDTTLTKNLIVNPYPQIKQITTKPICPGEAINPGNFESLAGASYVWSATPGIGLALTGNGNLPQWTVPGNTTGGNITGTVYVTATKGGCSGTMSFTVTISPAPQVNQVSVPSKCPGKTFDPINFSSVNNVPIASYTWSNNNSPGTGLGGSGTGSVIGTWTAAPNNSNSTVTGVVTVIATSTNGCKGPAMNFTVSVYPSPKVKVNSGSFCMGGSITLNASGANTYIWSPNTNLSKTSGQSVIANPSNSITYTVTGTDVNYCTNTAKAVVIVNPLPIVTVTSGPVNICKFNSTTLKAGGADTYAWSPITGLSPTTGAIVTASPTVTTTYTVTGTDKNGCVNSAKVVVNVFQLPTITVTSASFCAGRNDILKAVGAVNYTWSPSIGLSASTGTQVTASPTVTTTYTVTGTDNNGCVNTGQGIVTVYPLPVLVLIDSITVCPGQVINIPKFSLITTDPNASYKWSNDNTSINLKGNGTGNIVSWTAPTNTGNSVISGTITVTVTSTNGCVGLPRSFKVGISPVPNVTAQPTAISICSNTTTSIALSSTPSLAGLTYSWSVASPPGIKGWSNNTGTVISQTLVNTNNQTGTVTYTITPNVGSCAGAPIKVTVSVYPTSIVTVSPGTAIKCSGEAVLFSLGSVPPGASYAWSSPAVTGIGGTSSGTGSTINQTITNSSNTSQTVSYIITPTYNGCPGTPYTLTVTVNPTPDVTATPTQESICSGVTTSITFSSKVTGTTYSWSVIYPSGISGAGNGGGNTISQKLITTLTYESTVSYTVTPTYNGCPGQAIKVPITVKPNPDITVTPPSQKFCSGFISKSITFSSKVSGTPIYNWSATSPVYITGYEATGTGIIPTYQLNNTTYTSGTITFSITPILNQCVGIAETAIIIVDPTPKVDTIVNIISCPNQVINGIIFTGQPSGNTYSWSNDNTSINLKGNGTGNIVSWTAPSNTGNSVISGTITVTVTSTNGCIGLPRSFKVDISPVPNVTAQPTDVSICSNTTTSIALNSTPSLAGLTYSWSVTSPPGINGWSNNTGTVISQTLVNTNNQTGTVTYTITPNVGSCAGAPIKVTVSVYPTSTVTVSPGTAIKCSGEAVLFSLGSVPPGASYAWSSPAVTGIGGTSSGTGSIINQTITNSSNTPQTVNYIITPTYNGCPGTPYTLTVTVNPTPDAVATPTQESICSGGTTSITFSSKVTGTTYSWSVIYPSGISGAGNGGGNAISQKLITTLTYEATVTYTVTPTYNGCSGVPIQVPITVKPNPDITVTPTSQKFCSGFISKSITFSSKVSGTPIYNWSATSPVYITGYEATGTGFIPTYQLNNTTYTSGTITFSITPTLNQCTGIPGISTIIVDPTPKVDTIVNVISCPNQVINGIIFTGQPSGNTYSWSNDNTSINLKGNGTGNIVSWTAPTNTGNSVISGTITVTVTSTNGCVGLPRSFKVGISPVPNVTAQPTAISICSNTTTSIALSSTPSLAGLTYSWSVASPPGIKGWSNNTGDSNKPNVSKYQ